VARSTKNALGIRALRTANWLEQWAERLQEECEKQNFELYPKRKFANPALNPPDLATLSLKREDVRALIMGMWEHVKEIRKFKD
jgi:hypothetical protein